MKRENVDPNQTTVADQVSRAMLESGLIADWVVLVRTTVRGVAETVAYVVPAQNISPAQIKEQLKRRLEKQGATCLLVVVSTLPLTPEGEPDLAILERLAVCDAHSFPEWEALVRTQRGCDAVSVEETDAPVAAARVHLSDLAIPPPLADLKAPAAQKASLGSAPAEAAGETGAAPLSVSVGPALPSGLGLPEDLGATLVRTATAFPGHGVTYLYEDGAERFETYPELLQRAQRIFGGLRSLGLIPGDKVIFQLREHRHFVGAFWACQLGGFVPVPIAEAPSYQDPNVTLTKLKHAWQLLEHPLVLTRKLLVAPIQCLDDASGPGSFRAAAIEDLEAGDRDEAHHPCAGADLALMLLTSGSTGAPKAVMQSHRALLARCRGAQLSGPFGPEDVTLNWLPMDHVGGVVMFSVGDVCFGCNEVLAEPETFLRRPLSWFDWVDRFRVTFTWAPNFAFGLVNSQPEVANQQWDLSCLRYLLNGGEATVPKVARRFLELLEPYGLPPAAMHPAWGMSETCSAVIYSDQFTRANTSDDDRFTVVGKPVHGFSIRIADEAGAPIPEGRVGRLQVSGPCVTSGYYRDSARTAESFTSDGWLATGDLGFIRNGALTITGREKGVIIINGANYHSHEIETVVEEVPGVEASFAAACPVRRRDGATEDVAVFFVPSGSAGENRAETVRAIADAVRRRNGLNPGYVIPLAKTDIPKTEIGKIQRNALSKRFESGLYDPQLKELDLELNNERVIPNWFFRREWQRKNLGRAHVAEVCRGLLVLAAPTPLVDQLIDDWSARGWSCVVGLAGPGFAQESERRYRLNPQNPDDGRRLWRELSQANFDLGTVVFLNTLGPVASLDEASRDLAAVLSLVQTLAGSTFAGRPLRLQVVSSGAHWIANGDPEPWQAALTGLLRTAPQEYPWLACRHIDLQHGSSATAMIEQITAELACAESDAMVAYRGGHRSIPRFTRLAIRAHDQGASAVRSGGLYVVSGGGGGIGRLVTRWLIEQFAARVLWLGRRPEAAVAEEVHATGAVPNSLVYRSVDIADASAVNAAVEAVEQELGRPISGVFHLAGVFDETALEELTTESLIAALTPKTAGTVVLAELAARRTDCPLVIFSSVNGFFGGLSAGAYAAANSFVDEYAAYRFAQGQSVYSLAWTLWEETGMSVGYAMKELSRSRGFFVLKPWAAMISLAYALTRSERQLWIGLDTGRSAISQHCSAECQSLTIPVAWVTKSDRPGISRPRSLEVEDEFGKPFRLMLREAPPEASRAAAAETATGGLPTNALERLLSDVWTQVLSLQSVGVDENFFDCGGTSISMARVNAKLRNSLGRPIPMTAMFQYPTLRSLAVYLSAAGGPPEAPDHDEAEDRGSRRRARMQNRRSTDSKRKTL